MREGEENTHVQTLQWRRITVELSPSGCVRYIEMDGAVAMNVYSGPIKNWNDPDGVWTGCCSGCCICCPKGCVHFDVTIPPVTTLDTINVNNRDFKKRYKGQHVLSLEKEEEIPVVTATYMYSYPLLKGRWSQIWTWKCCKYANTFDL